MMILYLDTNEAFHATELKKGNRMVVVRPLKEQPPKGWRCEGIDVDGNIVFTDNQHYLDDNWRSMTIKLRYPVGVELAGKETYSYDSINETYRYKADGDEPTWSGWQSSAIMPKEAVRIKFKGAENRVDKVSEITIEEISMIGINTDCSRTKSYCLYQGYIMEKYDKNVLEQYAEIVTMDVMGARSGR